MTPDEIEQALAAAREKVWLAQKSGHALDIDRLIAIAKLAGARTWMAHEYRNDVHFAGACKLCAIEAELAKMGVGQ